MPRLALLLSLALVVLCVPDSRAQESAQIAKGKELYGEYCQLCHGADGKKGEGYQTPIWGEGSQIRKFETVQGLIDYMQLMPFNDPTLIDDEQRLAVIAYMLANHGTIPPSGEIRTQAEAALPIK